MAVFRVKKNKNFTVMSNHHLQNKSLSLKAKGLLSLMLSLPDTWDYSIVGLSCICKESVDGIRSIVKELEKHGYLIRRRVRNKNGKLSTTEYIILEEPRIEDSKVVENKPSLPKREKPRLDKPVQGKPILVFPTQLSTNIINKDIINKESIITII